MKINLIERYYYVTIWLFSLLISQDYLNIGSGGVQSEGWTGSFQGQLLGSLKIIS